jgi:Tfp pilus assembly protein PilV
MRSRRGFTLVEVLLAVLLIDVGLLALVATSAVLVRQTNALRLRNAALRTATNRIQQLGAGSCAATSGFAVTPDGVREQWSADSLGTGFLDVRDSVSFLVGSASHAVVLRTRVPC